MDISVVTQFPGLYAPFLETSLIGRAQKEGQVSFDLADLFSFAQPKERIDAPTFGHGAGMVLRPQVIEKAIAAQEEKHGKAYRIFFSPQGERLTQDRLRQIADKAQRAGHVMFVPARYEGMDARVEKEYADELISIGDYVLMGGDLPTMVVLEGMLRLQPGIVGKSESVEHESFSGPFFDYPSYTEPVEWHGMTVPEVLRSGNHAAIERWRQETAARNTVMQNFEWVRSSSMSSAQRALALAQIPKHYVALMHSDVLVGPEREPGVTSVTSIDIHDIARSSATYGIEKFFIVTPLIDQQKIVQKFLHFWHEGEGQQYNASRYEALRRVALEESFDRTCAEITRIEGKEPLVIATSARSVDQLDTLSFYDQGVVWQQDRPALLLFGTGRGLSEQLLRRADYLLEPLAGFVDFNHLSVRSAVAIVLDKWLGCNRRR